ncbi:MAG: hypothetical protein AMJ55_08775 [Gammaproteobacteria bacterium SG8_15]|nr:MAG: hypothetical protein AMJ55_08775 [Gammaproteobacteria bacterium SG8_15]
MNKTTMEKVQMYFDAALAVAPEKRTEFLKTLCGDDTELQNEVQALLDADAQSDELWDARPQISPTGKLRENDSVGPHRIVKQIGVGGMGVVYQALDSRLNRNVALKFLPIHFNSDETARERFYAEARAASQLDHVNICAIYDIGETDDSQLYITMPYYDGETLSSRLSRGALPLQESIDIALQIGDGLAAAHAMNIVHRDIKPANVMLTSDGGVKILDFGVAKVENVQLTSTGLSIGTLAYMSPEQLRGESVDARADVWALGVVFYEMLTGNRAFPGKVLPDILQAVLHLDKDNMRTLLGNVDSSLHSIIEAALARDPSQRYPDVASMLDDLIAVRMSISNKDWLPIRPAYSAQMSEQGAIKPKSQRTYKWNDSVLDSIAQILIPIIGPIAPKLVQRMAKQAASPTELRDKLANQLPTEVERQQFIKQIESQIAEFTTPPMPRTVLTDGSVKGVELSATQLAELETTLTTYLGPIARVLIKQSAAQAMSLDDLCNNLENFIGSPQQKLLFKEKAQTLLIERAET